MNTRDSDISELKSLIVFCQIEYTDWMHEQPLNLMRNDTNMAKALGLDETQQYH